MGSPPWRGLPNEAEIDAFADACMDCMPLGNEKYPTGWKLKESSTAWARVHGKGEGAALSARIARFLGVAGFDGVSKTHGRIEAVIIGMMLWPDEMRSAIALTPRERNALLKILGETPSQASHRLALAALHNRIMRRAAKQRSEDEDQRDQDD